METWSCNDALEAREAVAWAAAEGAALRLSAGGSKLALGRPVEAHRRLDLSALAGVSLYEPNELVLRAGAATPVAEVEALLAENRQRLAFEPADFGPLLGGPAGKATLGGLVAANVSGPRRVKAGALRDHLLGVTAINGRGEFFKSGGRVMKNVTGYDLPKLITGAYGTLGVITEVTLKLAPVSEDERTLVVAGLSDRAAVQALSDGLSSPCEVSAAAHLPENIAGLSGVAPVRLIGTATTLMRLEGSEKALIHRIERLRDDLRAQGHGRALAGGKSGTFVISRDDSQALWHEIRDVSYFVGSARPVWRISVAPKDGPAVAAAAGAERWFYDWGGGLVWLEMAAAPHAEEAIVRRALGTVSGHAMLFRADEDVRKTVPVFQPEPAELAQLTKRVKEAFDPAHILNPGLMYDGV
jgi:glycolate oxidase FAD binding subunit